MKVCVPVTTDKKETAKLSGHFGSAPFFALLDLEKDTMEFINNKHAHHEHGTCSPKKTILNLKVQSVIVKGIGLRALTGLNDLGISVYNGGQIVLSEVGAALKAGTLQKLNAQEACVHGKHNSDHDHPEEGGRGQGNAYVLG